jgi:hypothetical protein
MLCFFLSRFTIVRDLATAETLPSRPMPTARLAAYLFVGGAIPGLFLGNASVMFFPSPPPMLWLQGLVVGGLIGVVLAVMISAAGRRAQPA